MAKKNKSFEEYLARLEDISAQLESDDIGLEESIKLYEESISLSKYCYDALKNAELKITELQTKLEKNIQTDLEFDD